MPATIPADLAKVLKYGDPPTSGLSVDEQHAYDQRVFDGKTEGLTQDDVLDNINLLVADTVVSGAKALADLVRMAEAVKPQA
jgi:hypothetical protein